MECSIECCVFTMVNVASAVGAALWNKPRTDTHHEGSATPSSQTVMYPVQPHPVHRPSCTPFSHTQFTDRHEPRSATPSPQIVMYPVQPHPVHRPSCTPFSHTQSTYCHVPHSATTIPQTVMYPVRLNPVHIPSCTPLWLRFAYDFWKRK
jgi:hypothetical protein